MARGSDRTRRRTAGRAWARQFATIVWSSPGRLRESASQHLNRRAATVAARCLRTCARILARMAAAAEKQRDTMAVAQGDDA